MIHLNAKIISRGGEKPQSAVASAAYRSATKTYCEYDGEVKDFSRKGVTRHFIVDGKSILFSTV